MEDGTTVMNAVIPDRARGERLDKVLASVFPPYSRSQLQLWIRQGRITMLGRIPHGRERVLGGEAVRLEVPQPVPVAWQPQDLPLELVYEDADILVIDKPAGVVVHPGAGNPDGTLANAILYHFPELAVLPRAGLVHRIDKGTTGLLVVARNEHARSKLIRALECHAVSRCYLAVVDGIPISGGTPRGTQERELNCYGHVHFELRPASRSYLYRCGGPGQHEVMQPVPESGKEWHWPMYHQDYLPPDEQSRWLVCL